MPVAQKHKVALALDFIIKSLKAVIGAEYESFDYSLKRLGCF
jgi:hypothetical protein